LQRCSICRQDRARRHARFAAFPDSLDGTGSETPRGPRVFHAVDAVKTEKVWAYDRQ
jgi:hypothetical protein